MPNSIEPRSDDSTGSPFDRIRRIDDDGQEYWLARELQPIMGYEQWRRFEDVIERAIRAAENTGTYSDAAFAQVTELAEAGNLGVQPRKDYRLNRYGAYLCAMNGDPNKRAVAAAQSYFAVKTREAETATSKPMTEIEVARRYLAALEREQEMAKELEVAKPKASKWDAYCNADGLIGMTELADIVGTNVKSLTAWLVEIHLFRKQTSQGGGGRNMPRKGFQDSGHFAVKTENGVNFPVAYATPKGVDLVVDYWGRRTAA